MDSLKRTLMTMSCRDTDSIPKVEKAGQILTSDTGSVQIMHNGLKVVAGGYHGDWMAQIIRGLRGHHEPQEELAFHCLLRACRHNSLIVELGAFWSYYSLWYLQEIPGSRAICVEPDPLHKTIGEQNIAINGMTDRVRIYQAWVGDQALDAVTLHAESLGHGLTLPSFNMNSILERSGDATIELLHMDVQGAELPFLTSLANAVHSNRLRFVVASTHHSSISGSQTTHEDCLAQIRQMGGHILMEHDVQESFSGDGLIVASFMDHDKMLYLEPISRNRAVNSLFPCK